MGWFVKFRKYNKLSKELIYCKSELEYRLSLIEEIHPEFEEYQKEFCQKRDIDIDEHKTRRNQRMQPLNDPAALVGNLSKETLMKEKGKTREERLESRHFSHLYKKIAQRIHPDKLVSTKDPIEVKEKEELFKIASTAFKEHDWASLIEVANTLNLKPQLGTLPFLCKEISKSIESLREKILEEEKRYGYLYAMCETEEEKEALMKRLLYQFFGISI